MVQDLAKSNAQKARIRLVTADTHAKDAWVKSFIKDPDTVAQTADVVIAPPVLAAGISIDTHFKACFWFLHNGVLTHGEEYQMVRRLRHEARYEVMHPCAYAGVVSRSRSTKLGSCQGLDQLRAGYERDWSPISHRSTCARGILDCGLAAEFRRLRRCFRLLPEARVLDTTLLLIRSCARCHPRHARSREIPSINACFQSSSRRKPQRLFSTAGRSPGLEPQRRQFSFKRFKMLPDNAVWVW